MWCTSRRGILRDILNDLANEVPTKRDPNKPGPLVKAIAVKSLMPIPASSIAASTVGTIFSDELLKQVLGQLHHIFDALLDLP